MRGFLVQVKFILRFRLGQLRLDLRLDLRLGFINLEVVICLRFLLCRGRSLLRHLLRIPIRRDLLLLWFSILEHYSLLHHIDIVVFMLHISHVCVIILSKLVLVLLVIEHIRVCLLWHVLSVPLVGIVKAHFLSLL